MSFTAQITSHNNFKFLRCKECGNKNSAIKFYSPDFDKNLIINRNIQISYHVSLHLLCRKCFTQQSLKDLISDGELAKNDNSNFELQQLLRTLQEQIGDLVADPEVEILTNELNIPETIQLMRCLIDFTQEMKDLFQLEEISGLQQFSSFKSAGKLVNDQLQQILKEEIQINLGEFQKFIKKDIKKCKKSQKRIESIQREFLKQYEIDIKNGTISADQFKDYVENQNINQNIKDKQKALEKAKLIQEKSLESLS